MNLLRLIIPLLFTAAFVYLILYGINRQDSLLWREIVKMSRVAAIITGIFALFGAIALFFGSIQ